MPCDTANTRMANEEGHSARRFRGNLEYWSGLVVVLGSGSFCRASRWRVTLVHTIRNAKSRLVTDQIPWTLEHPRTAHSCGGGTAGKSKMV